MDHNRPGCYSWYVATVMMMTYAVQHIDRQIMSVVLEPVKREFQLADAQLGLLSGLAFAIAYSLAVLPLGMLIDRTNRKWVLSAVLAVWSGMTALGSFASSYGQLVAARLLVGGAEAGGSPAAISLIADYFPRDRRSGATGVFFFGQGLGILAGFALGGFIVTTYGWRDTLLVAGLPGLVLAALIALTIREPRRSAAAETAGFQIGLLQSLSLVWQRRSLFWLILGTLFGSVMVAAILVWIVSFLVRTHEVDLRSAGLAVGVGMGLAGALGAACGGFSADWFGRQRPANIPLQLALTQASAVASFALAFLSESYLLAVAAGAAGLMLSHTRDGPVYAWCAILAGNSGRGRVIAMVLLLNNLVGFGLGPLLAGLLSDFFAQHAGEAALQFALLTVVAIGSIAIIPFMLAARTIEADLEAAEEKGCRILASAI